MAEAMAASEPFLFIIDYELDHFHVLTFEEAAREGVYFDVKGRTNGVPAPENFPGESSLAKDLNMADSAPLDSRLQRHGEIPLDDQGPRQRTESSMAGHAAGSKHSPGSPFRFDPSPMPYSAYEKAFREVRKHIFHGNTFLLNLTFPTPLETDLTFRQVFLHSQAPYKLLFRDQFVVFSPENFIRIENDRIFSFPMKGTMDASLPDAEAKIMENEKEIREHNTIVDLIRNDLSLVANNVKVNRFRYVDRLQTHRGELLQVSSEISGELPADWKKRPAEILLELLPAGSICGAPKRKTLEIIAAAEGEKRGYFTGIFGIFDGLVLDSAVMIRYMERYGSGLRFRSGGGITGNSDAREEYDEMIRKVYVPIV